MTEYMKNILTMAFIYAFTSLLSAKEIQVDYKDLSYTVKQNSKAFTYQDKTFKKEYDLKACNKKQFEIFWARYEVSKKDITSLNKVNKKESLTLTEDKHISHINPDAKLGAFLKKVPDHIMAFEINEKMECKK
jgi:hypothetical protein